MSPPKLCTVAAAPRAIPDGAKAGAAAVLPATEAATADVTEGTQVARVDGVTGVTRITEAAG